MKKPLYLVVLLVILISAIAIVLEKKEHGKDAFMGEGDPAPDFRLRALDGNAYKLSDARGKLVILNFWASWCAPCREEMPSLMKVSSRLDEKDFLIFTISIDSIEERSRLKTYVNQANFDLPVLLDGEAKVAGEYGVLRVPETFIIDREGLIITRIQGAVDWMDERLVEALKVMIRQ